MRKTNCHSTLSSNKQIIVKQQNCNWASIYSAIEAGKHANNLLIRMTHGNPLFFNINDGGLEAQVHGYRAGLLTQTDYNNLTECDNLDGKSNFKHL